jgi:hypothetical protein
MSAAAPGSALPPTFARWVGLVGIGLAVTGALTWLIAPIDMPTSRPALADHYADHRTALIVTAAFVVGGNAVIAAFFVALAGLLDDDPLDRILGRVGVVGMAIQIAVVSVGFTCFAAVAYRRTDPETAQVVTDLGWLLINLAGGPVTAIAIVAFALGLTRARMAGPWLLAASAVAALAHLVVALAFARSGFLSPHGGIAIVVPVIYTTWIGLAGVALLRPQRGSSIR